MHFTEMRFASFLSGGFITAIVVNPPESKLAKRTSVHWQAQCGCWRLLKWSIADLLTFHSSSDVSLPFGLQGMQPTPAVMFCDWLLVHKPVFILINTLTFRSPVQQSGKWMHSTWCSPLGRWNMDKASCRSRCGAQMPLQMCSRSLEKYRVVCLWWWAQQSKRWSCSTCPSWKDPKTLSDFP